MCHQAYRLSAAKQFYSSGVSYSTGSVPGCHVILLAWLSGDITVSLVTSKPCFALASWSFGKREKVEVRQPGLSSSTEGVVVFRW